MVAVTENFASVDVDVFNFELFYVLSTLVAVFYYYYYIRWP